jgi:hypothetical protein
MPIVLPPPGAPTITGLSGLLGTGFFGNLSWGPGTDFHITNLKGLDDLPGIRSNDQPRGNADGDFSGSDFLAGRVFSFDLLIIAKDNATMFADLALVEASFQPYQNFTGVFAIFNGSRVLNARCRKRAPAYDSNYKRYTCVVPVEMYAPDPRVYDGNPGPNPTASLVSPTGGFVFPLTFPLAFGLSSTPGTVTITNKGNWPVWPVYAITGPCSNPSIITAGPTTTSTLTFGINLVAGDTLVVDSDTHSVTLNGTASRRSSLQPGSTWQAIQPGSWSVTFTAAGFQAGARLSVYAPSSWI